eukprot:gene9891-2213_t
MTNEEIEQFTIDKIKDIDKWRDKEVFMIGMTNEIFLDYEDYVNRVILYKQQVWICKYTGRKNLSYMAAINSEQKHVERIYFSRIPKYIIYPMIKILHDNKNDVNDIINFIYEYFDNNYIFGEELYCEIEKNIMYPIQILRIIEKEKTSISFLTNQQDIIYEVQLLKKKKEKYLVGESSLFRKDIPISKKRIIEFIKDNCIKNEENEMIKVDAILLEYFGLKQQEEQIKQPISKIDERENIDQILIIFNFIQYILKKKLNLNNFYDSIKYQNDDYKHLIKNIFKKDFKKLNSFKERINYLLNLIEELMIQLKDSFLEYPRSEPLGYDRFFNRYWFFNSNVLFLEIKGIWHYYDSINQIDNLLKWLSDKNIRERNLKINLKRIYHEIMENLNNVEDNVGVEDNVKVEDNMGMDTGLELGLGLGLGLVDDDINQMSKQVDNVEGKISQDDHMKEVNVDEFE